jgi:hypothetical protein
MAEPHLYSVDPNGVATPPPPDNPGGTEVQGPKRAKSKARPNYAVPTDRMKFPETQVASLISSCVASRNGQVPVTSEAQANFMGVSPATAGLNNGFFVSLGLLKKVGKGAYMPTELALQFQQKWSFDKEGAPALLQPAFRGQWFHEAVKQRVQVGRPTVKQAIETLAGVAGTDSSYEAQYGLLLDWLEYVGLITTTSGTVALVGEAPEREAEETTVAPILGEQATVPPEPAPSPKPQQKLPVVSLSIEVSLTAEDLATLPPDAITALFDGIGKVAFVKAVIDRN